MKRLTYPVPSTINRSITPEIAAALALSIDDVAVSISGEELEVVVPDDADELLVAAAVAAHTGLPTAAQLAEEAAEAEAEARIRDLEPILAKCREVVAGTGTFTVAQRDRLLAALTLTVHRRLSR